MQKSGTTPQGIIVAHPGNPVRSHEAVLAMQETGCLKQYVTGFYFRPNGIAGRFLRHMPPPLRQRIDRELSGRYRPQLDPGHVRTVVGVEFFFILAHRLKLSKRSIAKIWRWRIEWFDRALARILERERPNVLLCYSSGGVRALRKAKSLGIFTILDQMMSHLDSAIPLYEEESRLHPDFAPSTNQPVVDWVLNRSREEVRLADLLLVGSDYVRDSLLKIGIDPERIAVLPYGVDTVQFRPAPTRSAKKCRLLFAGLISQRKGIKYLLEAVKQLNLRDLELLMVGRIDGVEEGLVPYRPYFTHVQNLPHQEVHRIFQTADVFVFPSLHEGSALVTYEALACGLPVITTENAGSVVRDGVEGFIVPIRDVNALKEKILLLYRDTELREKMGRRARQRAEQFTWADYRRRLSAVVEQVLQPRTTRSEAKVSA
jgi:glycosyltransferase involved in cell wall biosynthesis